MSDRLKPLVSLPFIISLILLLVNDFYLKQAFHNALTGKLSDFCGLFIFPIFWSVLFARHKLWIFLLIGALFVFWKSEYSAVLIHLVSNSLFGVQRTIDYTDLMALPMLGLAWRFLKEDAIIINVTPFLKNVSPYPVAILTIFSFCATSRVHYVQTFDQPQYVLFKADALPDSTQLEEDFHFYHMDSLLVIEVNQLYMTDRPARNDDYQKNLAIKDLDKNIFRLVPGIKSLMSPGQVTTLTVKTPKGNDQVRFNGGRLDGQFIRKKDGKPIIEGFYKMGLEDSVWTFKDVGSSKITKTTFVNGEKTGVQQFEGGSLISSNSVSTRADIKRNKAIQIAVLLLLMVGTITLIVKNYRQRPEQLKVKLYWKWLACLLLPFFVWLLQFVITNMLGDYQPDLLFLPVAIFMVFIITCPLLFIIVFGIKLSRQIDVLWYSLLFALAFSLWAEYDILSRLSV